MCTVSGNKDENRDRPSLLTLGVSWSVMFWSTSLAVAYVDSIVTASSSQETHGYATACHWQYHFLADRSWSVSNRCFPASWRFHSSGFCSIVWTFFRLIRFSYFPAALAFSTGWNVATAAPGHFISNID